ncbi:MAG: HpcH/HpaI aldolase/citrate lyase family protein [Gammaproteobacteria bacterium]|nr:HpcH/HpaI aldolase/citrate lyase family protein [Gammaproteobacteria bacterium]
MNKLELQMTELLLDLKQNYHVSGIKAEFEAEGTRMEEAMRLKDVTSSVPGLGLNIKIGGCEAIKDMFDAISLGAQRIIAPMVETPYALQKFIRAAQLVYGENIDQVEILVNIETFAAYQCFDQMLAIPEIKHLNGIVIGRVDMVGSMGIGRAQVNSKQVLDLSLDLAKKAKAHGLKVVVGGGVSADAIPFFKAFPADHLDRFETRKIIFNGPAAIENPEVAFIKAVQFELMWLKNKRNYYAVIAREDEDRLQMMQERYETSLQTLKATMPDHELTPADAI